MRTYSTQFGRAVVQPFDYKTPSGKPIRKATKVVFDDGTEIPFTERISAKLAVAQAISVRLNDSVRSSESVYVAGTW